EGALVDEAEFGVPGVGEADADAQVLLVGRGVRLDEELSAHAQVGQDRLAGVLEGQPQVLAAAARGADAVALEAVREVVGACEVAAHGARMEHLSVCDGPVGDPPLESAPYDLDLGQFGHVSSPPVVSGPPVRAGVRPERPPRSWGGRSGVTARSARAGARCAARRAACAARQAEADDASAFCCCSAALASAAVTASWASAAAL